MKKKTCNIVCVCVCVCAKKLHEFFLARESKHSLIILHVSHGAIKAQCSPVKTHVPSLQCHSSISSCSPISCPLKSSNFNWIGMCPSRLWCFWKLSRSWLKPSPKPFIQLVDLKIKFESELCTIILHREGTAASLKSFPVRSRYCSTHDLWTCNGGSLIAYCGAEELSVILGCLLFPIVSNKDIIPAEATLANFNLSVAKYLLESNNSLRASQPVSPILQLDKFNSSIQLGVK